MYINDFYTEVLLKTFMHYVDMINYTIINKGNFSFYMMYSEKIVWIGKNLPWFSCITFYYIQLEIQC